MNKAGKDSWKEVDYYPDERAQKALLKEFRFSDFKEAIDFVNRVGQLAEQASHHPDINVGWGYARIWLTTHDAHTITKKDHDLAKSIDAIDR